MIEKMLHTDPDYAWTFLRIIAGLIVFPYGMQKLFGWFGGPGIDGTLKDLDSRRIPRSICMADHRRTVFWKHCASSRLFRQIRGWWSVHNLYGCAYSAFARWMSNELVWRKEREGIEYHVMLLSLLLIAIVRGSGAMSIDLWLTS
jgi:putative oxidoreductase